MPEPGSVSKKLTITVWVVQGVLAGAFVFMGALPKLMGDPMAVELFERIGFGQGFRLVVGLTELAAAVLLVIPRTALFGGLLAAGAMVGAIGAHLLTPLGVMPEFVVNEVTGETEAQPMILFAAMFLVLALAIVAIRRGELLALVKRRGKGA